MTRIATWNVNSIRARLPRVLEWLAAFSPDIVLAQELKATDETFPREAIEDAGVQRRPSAEKNFKRLRHLRQTADSRMSGPALPGDAQDDQARYIEAFVGASGWPRSTSPSGNPAPGENSTTSCAGWTRSRRIPRPAAPGGGAGAGRRLQRGAATDGRLLRPRGLGGDALCRRNRARATARWSILGLTDAYRAFNRAPHAYSFWDYQGGAWQKDFGLLIDHLLLSPQAADRLSASGIDRGPRGKARASDHTPVWCEIDPPG